MAKIWRIVEDEVDDTENSQCNEKEMYECGFNDGYQYALDEIHGEIDKRNDEYDDNEKAEDKKPEHFRRIMNKRPVLIRRK